MKVSIYALFDIATPEITRYVGQTMNLHVRLARHLSGKDKTTSIWASEVAKAGSSIGWRLVDTTDEFNAGDCESKWIEKLDSEHLLNIQRNRFFDDIIKSDLMSMRELESRYAQYAVTVCAGNRALAAKRIGIGRQTLYNILARQF